jgi:hypothetical protein
MTHSFEKAAVLSIGLVGMVGSAFAAQPPDVVQSAQQSTAMGTGALQNLGDAGNDTAAGYLAAYNTSGGATPHLVLSRFTRIGRAAATQPSAMKR